MVVRPEAEAVGSVGLATADLICRARAGARGQAGPVDGGHLPGRLEGGEVRGTRPREGDRRRHLNVDADTERLVRAVVPATPARAVFRAEALGDDARRVPAGALLP